MKLTSSRIFYIYVPMVNHIVLVTAFRFDCKTYVSYRNACLHIRTQQCFANLYGSKFRILFQMIMGQSRYGVSYADVNNL